MPDAPLTLLDPDADLLRGPPILAEFAAPAEGAAALGDVVRRRAPVVFRAGHYEFANAPPYTMTPEDIRAACEAFEPVPFVDTHVGSEFDRKLAEARVVRLLPTPDWTAFGAELEVPRWFEELFKGESVNCSATWDRQTKRLKNLALVPNPRIPDAVIEAAFAREQEASEKRRQHTAHGQEAMQDLHDRAARAGARCNPDAAFTADHGADALQQVHDLAVDNGARCATYPEPDRTPPEPEKKKEAAMSAAASPPPAPAPEWEARFAALEKGHADALAAIRAENEALKKRSEALEKANREAHLRRIAAEAAAFAREQVRQGKAFAAERADVEAEFAEAAVEDLDAPREVTFAAEDGKPVKGTRLDRLRARWARKPANPLAREKVSDRDGAEALFDRGGAPAPLTAEQRDKLFSSTPTGQAILRERAAARPANGR